MSLFADPLYLDLPDADLWYCPVFLQPDKQQQMYEQLVEQTAWRQDTLRIAGKTVSVPRLSAWYGEPEASYTYSGVHFNPLPWLPLLKRVHADIESASAALAGQRVQFNSVLLNWYRNGRDSVAWHADDEPELGNEPVIASLSLGVERRFLMKHRDSGQRFALPLVGGSLLLMAGKIQKCWLHQIPKENGVQHGRINLTFRRIRRH